MTVGTVTHSLRVPGDKSISHRALMCAALATGKSTIARILPSADVHSTAGVLRALGVSIPPLSDRVRVEGRGLGGLTPSLESLDCGNSGTTARLMSGAGTPPDEPATVKVVEEHLTVDTVREDIGAVRVHIENDVHEQPVTLDEVVEQVVVERAEVNRRVEHRRGPWYEDDTLVVPVYAEVEVIERHLVLAAEIRLRRQVQRSSHASTVPVTRQRAVVERRLPDGTWTRVDPEPS